MTVVMEPSQSPLGSPSSTVSNAELGVALEQLLYGYLEQLDAEHPQWSQDEVALVRQTRDLLVRAGHTPRLDYTVLNHIDSPYANKPLSERAL